MKSSALTPQQAAIDAAVQAALTHATETGQACVVFVLEDGSVLPFYGDQPLREEDRDRVKYTIAPKREGDKDASETET